MTSPTQRTLKALRGSGAVAQVVEYWNPHANIRVDLYGFIDVVACFPGRMLGVQATGGGNGAARASKITNECATYAHAWIAAGGEIEVWDWKRYAKPLNRKWWRPRVWTVESRNGELVAEVRSA